MRVLLSQGLSELGLDVSRAETLERFSSLLLEKNQVMNLTAITEYGEVMRKHFVDSLALKRTERLSGGEKLIDIGTGAGFPGIPLKIAFPDLQVVLLDSLNKRIKFLDQVIEKLELQGIRAVHGRAEDFARQAEYREQFDFCVSRAVANLASLSEYCLPYVKRGGYFISYKSGNVQEEITQAKKAVFVLGGERRDTIHFCLPGSDIERSLVIVEKINTTPKKYPRKAGIPAKEPIQ